MENIEQKEMLVKLTEELKLKHENVKVEMIKILEAAQLLDKQYGEFEKELYSIEEQYIQTMKKLI